MKTTRKQSLKNAIIDRLRQALPITDKKGEAKALELIRQLSYYDRILLIGFMTGLFLHKASTAK